MTEALIRALPIWKQEIHLEPLGGGITNLNFKVTDGAQTYVARQGSDDPRLGISRHNEFLCASLAADAGLAPSLVFKDQDFSVIAFVPGKPLLLQGHEENLQRCTQTLQKLHSILPANANELQTFCPFQVARNYVADAQAHQLPLPCKDSQILLQQVQELQSQISEPVTSFCHNDLMPGNLLDTGAHIWVIDWEYAGMGNPLFDLAGLCNNFELDPQQELALLHAYYGNALQLHPLLVMRALAALRESLWAVVQGSQSNIPFDYPAYRDEQYQRYLDTLKRLQA